MSRGINKVILVGNVGAAPEIKTTQSGQQMAKFSLATSSTWKDKDGNPQEKTEWHRVVIFGKLSDIVAQYVHKGSKLYIEGSIKYGKYTDKDGIEKYSTDIVANDITMLDSKQPSSGQNGQQQLPLTSGAEEDPDDCKHDDIPF